MNLKTTSFVVVLCLLLSAFPLSAGNAVKTMAQILIGLNHYPSAAEKDKLKGMMSSMTANEKIIATAMINLNHSASAADKKKLAVIMKSNSATAGEKALAKIVAGLNHMVSADDKKVLSGL